MHKPQADTVARMPVGRWVSGHCWLVLVWKGREEKYSTHASTPNRLTAKHQGAGSVELFKQHKQGAPLAYRLSPQRRRYVYSFAGYLKAGHISTASMLLAGHISTACMLLAHATPFC